MSDQSIPSAEDEVVDLCRDLIRIDTSNPGDKRARGAGGGGVRRREACRGRARAEDLRIAQPSGPAWWRGLRARSWAGRPAHPRASRRGSGRRARTGQRDPFGGDIHDGCVWGRGAVDMKDMDAMVLAVFRQRMREGRRPPRDVVLAFVADEEAGGGYGAQLAGRQPCRTLRGVHRGDQRGRRLQLHAPSGERLYLIQTAEKGMAWMRLTARGHGGPRLDGPSRTTPSPSWPRPSPGSGAHDWPSSD